MRSPNFLRAEISNAALLGNKPLFKGMWHDALCLWIFGTTVFCSSKLAVFLELWFWKLFASRSRLCPRTNIIFWRQRYSITLVHFFTDLALSTSIGLHQTTLDISGSRNDLLCLFFLKRFSSWNRVRLSRTSCSFLKTRYWFRIPYYGARGECGVWLEENKSNVLWSYLGNLSSFRLLCGHSIYIKIRNHFLHISEN